jgi:hypothetical protein
MTDYVALSDLRTLVRQRADQENSQFVTDEELRQYINRGYAELYDLLVTNATSEDYFLNSSTVTLVSGTQTYDLPADFYKLRGVDLNMGSDSFPLRRYNFPQRDVGSRYSVPYRYRYHVQGSSLRLTPSPSTNDTLTVWYIPSPKKFLEKTVTAITRGSTTMWTVGANHGFAAGDKITGVSFINAANYNVDQTISAVGAATVTTDLDSSGLSDPTTFGNIETRLDFYSGWDTFVICSSAIDCVVKEEGDPSALMTMKEGTKNRILSVSDNRDLGEPATVTDMAVYYTDPGSYTWYS